MKRSPIKRARAKRRTPEQVAASMLWHREVMRQGYALLADGETVAVRFHAHHVIPQQTLRRKAYDLGKPEDDLVWDARVGVPMSERRHALHHAGIEPLRWNHLPEQRRYYLQMFAVENELEPWLERHVPGYSR